MGGVGIEGGVGDDAERRHRFLNRGDGAWHQAVFIVGFAAICGFQLRAGIGEEGDGRYTQAMGPLRFPHRFV